MVFLRSHYGFSARAAVIVATLGALPCGPTADAGVRGEFDYPLEVVACPLDDADGGAEAYFAVYEVTIPVSFRTRSGDPADVRQIEVVLTLDSEEELQLADYRPRTSLETAVVGEIEEKTIVEESRNFSGAVAASIPIPGVKAAQVGPSANYADAERTVRTETVRRRPKMEAIVVAGNTSRGKGAFFQLRPGPAVTLEGAHHFTLRIVAPRNVHAVAVSVHCRAVAEEDWILFRRDAEVARSRGTVKILFASPAVAGSDPPAARAAVVSDVRETAADGPGGEEPDAPDSSAATARGPYHYTDRPCPWCDEVP